MNKEKRDELTVSSIVSLPLHMEKSIRSHMPIHKYQSYEDKNLNKKGKALTCLREKI